MVERLALLVGVGWLAATVALLAHHNFASEFDASQPVAVTGAVTRLEVEESPRLVLCRRQYPTPVRFSGGAWRWAAPMA